MYIINVISGTRTRIGLCFMQRTLADRFVLYATDTGCTKDAVMLVASGKTRIVPLLRLTANSTEPRTFPWNVLIYVTHS